MRITEYWVPSTVFSFPVLVSLLRLLADQGDLFSVDEDVFHVGLHIERIAVGHHDVGELACVERSQAVIDAPNRGGVDGQCLESFFVRQAEGHGVTGGVWEI